MRTTIDISDEAYHIAKTVAREQKRSLGSVITEFIVAKYEASDSASLSPSAGTPFPTFRCIRRVTSADVGALDDE